MGKINETVKSFNATVRTLLAVVLVAGAAYLGYQGYEIYNKPHQVLQQKEQELALLRGTLAEMGVTLASQQREIERLDTSIRLLKVDRRVAQLRVIDQQRDSAGQEVVSTVEFVETNPEGQAIGEPRQFEIIGDMVYIDYLVAKFDDHYIEQADLERGTAICLFQRIFGEQQEPGQGYRIDQVGTRPTAYARGGHESDFERKIWRDFWTIAHQPDRARQLGIRAVHGNAASIRVRPGMTYQLDLRSTGEFSLRPMASVGTAAAPAI